MSPVCLFVQTSLINLAGMGGNGNRFSTQKLHVQSANSLRSPQCQTKAQLLFPSRPPSFFVTFYFWVSPWPPFSHCLARPRRAGARARRGVGGGGRGAAAWAARRSRRRSPTAWRTGWGAASVYRPSPLPHPCRRRRSSTQSSPSLWWVAFT
jgi:hypothetical protein